jgi:hypothetical protein
VKDRVTSYVCINYQVVSAIWQSVTVAISMKAQRLTRQWYWHSPFPKSVVSADHPSEVAFSGVITCDCAAVQSTAEVRTLWCSSFVGINTFLSALQTVSPSTTTKVHHPWEPCLRQATKTERLSRSTACYNNSQPHPRLPSRTTGPTKAPPASA